METEVLTWKQTQKAADILKNGGLVAFPTETVYGLACVCDNEAAFKALVGVKNRPPEKPFTLMCASLLQALPYFEISAKTIYLLQNELPGELTVLLKAQKGLPRWITLGSPTIGIRIPASEDVRNLIETVGRPLLVPSANISGKPTGTTKEQVMADFDGKIDAIIEGECLGKTPSTIVDLTDGIKLIRKGPVLFERLETLYNKCVMKIVLGSDHGGFKYKEAIKSHLLSSGFEVIDVGAYDENSCDYPLFAHQAAEAVATGKAEFGILCCTSGEGIAIAANKVKGIRCGIGYDDEVVEKCREHNNCNMIAFGQKYMKEDDVLRRVDIFLTTPFSPLEKHHRRVDQISEIDKENN